MGRVTPPSLAMEHAYLRGVVTQVCGYAVTRKCMHMGHRLELDPFLFSAAAYAFTAR